MFDGMLFWCNQIIVKVLSEKEPNLNYSDNIDRQVFLICMDDFKIYLKWFEKNAMRVEEKFDIGVDDSVNFQNIKELAEFIEVWVNLWLKKYRERVKLLFSMPKNDPLMMRGMKNLRSFTQTEKENIMDEVIKEFIRNGEICRPVILADAIFKRILGRYESEKWNISTKLTFLYKLKHEAKALSYTHGHLIFITPRFGKYRLREYRDDDVTKII